MKEDFIIRIKSRTEQFDHMQPVRTGEDDRIEIMTYGSLVKKGDTYYITYKETQTIGFEGCTTTIKIAADGSRVAMLRFGPANAQLIVERDRRNICYYETEVGSLTLGVTGDGIDCKLTEKGGSAAFSFFAFAARCFFSCAAFFLGLAASFFFGLTLGFCFAASGFFTSRLLDLRLFFGLNLGILHKDAFFTNFNLNGVGTPRSVGLFDDALFFSVDGDLALTCLRTLNAQAVEQPALVGVGKDVVSGVLGDAGSAQLREKRLDGKLQLERKFFNRHAGHV